MSKTSKLKKRIKALERIVKANSITFTDPTDPTQSVVMKIEDGQFKTVKQKATIAVPTEKPITTHKI